MEPLKITRGVCPHCGKTVPGYGNQGAERQVYYDSPIRTCKKCKQEYLDPRYHEIAVDGIPQQEFSVKYALMRMGIAAAGFAVAFVINLLSVMHDGSYYIMLAVLQPLMLVLVLYCLIDIIRIKTGAKMKSFEKKRAASEARLQDRAYAQRLAEAGYPVPEQYLQ